MEPRWHTVRTNWSRHGPRLRSDNLRRGYRLQDRGAVQGQSGSRQHVVAHCRGGREVRRARGGIREHEAFLGHEMRGPAGIGRGGVSMAGGWQGTGKREGVRGCRLPSPTYFPEFTHVFQLSVSMKKVASDLCSVMCQNAPTTKKDSIHSSGRCDDDCFYYHSWRNNVVIAYGPLSSFVT